MSANAVPLLRSSPDPVAQTSDNLTDVELIWIEKKTENWIRFGQVAHEAIIDRHRRIVSFRPNCIFAFVRWSSNDHGTIISRIDILRAVRPDEAYQTLNFVRPGGDILLKIDGWPKVQQVFRHIDAVESAGIDPQDVSADHWRHVHHRLIAGLEPRAYTKERHQAWLKRREIEG